MLHISHQNVHLITKEEKEKSSSHQHQHSQTQSRSSGGNTAQQQQQQQLHEKFLSEDVHMSKLNSTEQRRMSQIALTGAAKKARELALEEEKKVRLLNH